MSLGSHKRKEHVYFLDSPSSQSQTVFILFSWNPEVGFRSFTQIDVATDEKGLQNISFRQSGII